MRTHPGSSLVLAVLFVAVGCSPASNCPSCPGCCDSAGVCQGGNTPQQCGKNGSVCVACSGGSACNAGVCASGSGGSGGSGGAGGGSGGSGGSGGAGGGSAVCSTTPIEAQMPTGGCSINLVAPPACTAVNLSGGGNFEFDWTTNTTFCEGPHTIYFAGSPVSSWANGNYVSYQISSGQRTESGMTRNIGGYVFINSQSIQGVTSDTGVYYWRVESYYGSRSETKAFVVQ